MSKKNTDQETPVAVIRTIADVLGNPEADWKVDYKSLLYDICGTVQAMRQFNGQVEAVINNHGDALTKLQGDTDGSSMEDGEAANSGAQSGTSQEGSVPTDNGPTK